MPNFLQAIPAMRENRETTDARAGVRLSSLTSYTSLTREKFGMTHVTGNCIEELLRKALHYSDGYCLLDPRLTNWVSGLQINDTGDEQNVHLTPCERAILTLREQGLKASEIAQLRSISQATVKKTPAKCCP